MPRKVLVPIICVFSCLILFAPAIAQPSIEQLQMRIDKLEKELIELKLLLEHQQKAREEEKANAEKSGEKREEPKAVTGVGDGSDRIISQFRFKPYGYIKLDAVYDDSRTNYGNFILYVPNESAHRNDNEFNITARQTRIGIDIIAPELAAWTAQGRIEFDFYGDGSKSHENKAEPMLRHAFITLTRGKFNLIAGQTSDLISPLNPYTLNYTVGWAAGNVGYRRPQLRMTYSHPFGDRHKLTSAVAIARTAGLANEDLDLDLQNDGEDAGFPTVQARCALGTKLFTAKESVVGISGHYGEEEIDWGSLTPGKHQKRVKSWSINGDLDIPFSDRWALTGEIFAGYNLDDYFGGILQGVNADARTAVKAIGGWTQLSYQQSPSWKYNLGFGIDDPSNDDLSTGMRSRNSFYYLNTLYSLIPPLTIGLEYSYWETEYQNMSTGTDNRVQTSVIYNW